MLLHAFIRKKVLAEQSAPLAKQWANLIGVIDDTILNKKEHILKVKALLLTTEKALAKAGSASGAHYCHNLHSYLEQHIETQEMQCFANYKNSLLCLIGLLDSNVQYNVITAATQEGDLAPWRGWMSLAPNNDPVGAATKSETLEKHNEQYTLASFNKAEAPKLSQKLFVALLNVASKYYVNDEPALQDAMALAGNSWADNYIDGRAWASILWLIKKNTNPELANVSELLGLNSISTFYPQNTYQINKNKLMGWASWEALEGDFSQMGHILDTNNPNWGDVAEALEHTILKSPKEQNTWNPGIFLQHIARSIANGKPVIETTPEMKMRFAERLALWKDSLLLRNRDEIEAWEEIALVDGELSKDEHTKIWFERPHPQQKSVIRHVMATAADEINTNAKNSIAIASLFGYPQIEDVITQVANSNHSNEYPVNFGLLLCAYECINKNETYATQILQSIVDNKASLLFTILQAKAEYVPDVVPSSIYDTEVPIFSEDDFDIISAALSDVEDMTALLTNETTKAIQTMQMTSGWERATHSLKTLSKTLSQKELSSVFGFAEEWAGRKIELNEPISSLEAISMFGLVNFMNNFVKQKYDAKTINQLNLVPNQAEIEFILPRVETVIKPQRRRTKTGKLVKQKRTQKPQKNQKTFNINSDISKTEWYKYVPNEQAIENAEDAIDKNILLNFQEEADELFEQLDSLIGNIDGINLNTNVRSINAVLHTLKGGAKISGMNKLGDWVHSLEDFTNDIGYDVSADNIKKALQYSYDKARTLYRITLDTAAEKDNSIKDGNILLRVQSNDISRIANSVTETRSIVNSNKSALNNTKKVLQYMQDATHKIDNIATEIQNEAETWMHSGGKQQKAANSHFDALEMDKFNYLNELTRKLFEAASDVTTLRTSSIETINYALNLSDNAGFLLDHANNKLEHIFREPVSKAEARLSSAVRSACIELNKKANIVYQGTSLLIEKTTLDTLIPALEHLVRNGVAHGITEPAKRREQGKNETGTIYLSSYRSGKHFKFEVWDNGNGLNFLAIESKAKKLGLISKDEIPSKKELCEIIFEPAFSTSEEVNQISGRGVGLDAVMKAAVKLGGKALVSLDDGVSKFVIEIPVSAWTISGLVVEDNNMCLIIPSENIEATELCITTKVEQREDGLYMPSEYKQAAVPFISTSKFYNNEEMSKFGTFATLVHLKNGQALLSPNAKFVEHQVVKPISNWLTQNTGVLGTTILPEGDVAIVTDINMLKEHIIGFGTGNNTVEATEKIVLVVDDSLTVRKVTTNLLKKHNMIVETAENGLVAVEKIKHGLKPHIILMDIEMPIMDGFEACSVILGTLNKSLPIVFISSRAVEKHQNHAKQLGAKHFLGKPYNDDELLDTINKYIL